MSKAETQYPRSRRMVDLLDLHSAPFNPPDRVKKVDDLLREFKQYGQLEPIHVVMVDGVPFICEGHRRVESGRQLGWTKIEAFVYHDEGLEVLNNLYMALNKPKMSLKAQQSMTVALQGGPIFNKTVETAVNYVNGLFPEEERGMLVRAGVGPYLVSVAKRISKYVLEHNEVKNKLAFNRQVKKTLLWLIRRETQQASIAYMRMEYSPTVLRNAIDNDLDHVPRFAALQAVAAKSA